MHMKIFGICHIFSQIKKQYYFHMNRLFFRVLSFLKFFEINSMHLYLF